MRQKKGSDERVVLVYNGQEEVEANRQALAESCFYLDHLLTGPFREAQQSRIEIHLGEEFSFSVFKAMIDYANSRLFDRDYDVMHYLGMRQLAELWMYDELIEIVDSHLISCICPSTLVNIHTRANIFRWNRLQEECLKAERMLDASLGSVYRNWPRCPMDGHNKHHYSNCPLPGVSLLGKREENWDDEEPESLTEEEKDMLAEMREIRGMFSLRRNFYRRRKF